MTEHILLTPGPLTTSAATKAASVQTRVEEGGAGAQTRVVRGASGVGNSKPGTVSGLAIETSWVLGRSDKICDKVQGLK